MVWHTQKLDMYGIILCDTYRMAFVAPGVCCACFECLVITKWVGFFYYKMGTYYKMGRSLLQNGHILRNGSVVFALFFLLQNG